MTSLTERMLSDDGMVRSVLVAANPVAGGFRAERLARFARRLGHHGVRCEVILTRHAGHLTEIAAEEAVRFDALVVGGGDGSINEAVRGLCRSPAPGTALGILPFGTANVLAHELALPFRPEVMADLVASGETAPLHLGRIGERPFVLMVSAGFDADVVHAVDPAAKRRWGKLAYAAAALRLALARQGRDVVVEADGDRIVCSLAVATTARYYGGPLAITGQTHVTVPGLRLVTLADDRPGTLARAALALALGRLHHLPEVTDRPVEAVRFQGEGVRFQIDGDRLEATDATIGADPVPLRVFARRTAQTPWNSLRPR